MMLNPVTTATRGGVGYSELPNPLEAGAEAARRAMAQAGVDVCDLVFLFATAKQDPVAVRDGVRSVVGRSARLMGGATVGVITNDFLGYEGHQVGVAVVKSPALRIELFHEPDISNREHDAGFRLGERVRAAFPSEQPGGLVIMYDVVNTGIGSSLNLATPFLAGMAKAIGTWPTTAGGALMGDLQFSRGFQWIDDQIVTRSAAALAFSGLRMDTIQMHGCRPSGRYRTVTAADGNMVLEIDGRPALDVVAEMLGPNTERSAWEDYPIFVTFGINNGDKFGPFREDDYAVRLCSAVDRARGGLAFFGDDLQPGQEFQLMRRSLDLDYMSRRVGELMGRVEGRRPVLALYIDCAGRCSAMTGTDGEEATEIQKALGDRVPLIGLYVGGEIARAGDVMQSHNWAGVLSIFSEEA